MVFLRVLKGYGGNEKYTKVLQMAVVVITIRKVDFGKGFCINN